MSNNAYIVDVEDPAKDGTISESSIYFASDSFVISPTNSCQFAKFLALDEQ